MASDRPTARTAIAGFGAALLLVANLAVVAERQGERSSASLEAPAAAPGVAPSAPTAPAPSTPREDGAPSACTAGTRERISEVVQAQLDAFASDDWDEALGFATEGFRDAFDAQELEVTILTGYPTAARSATSRLGECATLGPLGQALVTVEALDGDRLDLLYQFAMESGEWRIAGAVDAPTVVEPGGDSDGTTV